MTHPHSPLSLDSLVTTLLESLNLTATEVLTSRRGCIALRATDRSGKRVIVKTVVAEAGDTKALAYSPSTSLLWESEVYTQHFPAEVVTVGNTPMPYLVLTERTGGSASDKARALKSKYPSVTSTEFRGEFLNLLQSLAEAVDHVHALGLTHGDLQPAHFVFDHQGHVGCIDLALTMPTGNFPFPYKGGLSCFNAPELCRDLLEFGESSRFNQAAEIFTFAAIAFWLYTGSLHFQEPETGSNDTRLKVISVLDSPRTFAEVGADAWPALEQALRKGMSLTAEQRPSSASELIQLES